MFRKLLAKLKAWWGYVALGFVLLLALFKAKRKAAIQQPVSPAAPLLERAEERVQDAAGRIDAVLDAAPDLKQVEVDAQEQAAKEHKAVADSTNPYGTV